MVNDEGKWVEKLSSEESQEAGIAIELPQEKKLYQAICQ
jgi:hypothetical protein